MPTDIFSRCTKGYPLEYFPVPLSTLIREIHDFTGIPLEIIATEVLATIAACVQGHAVMKTPGRPPTPLGIFVQSILKSGKGKGVVAEIVGRELVNHDKRCDAEALLQSDEYRILFEEWEDKREVLRGKRRAAMRNEEAYAALTEQRRLLKPPPEPESRRLIFTDVSLTALKLRMAEGPVYLTHNEGGDFYQSKLSDHTTVFCSAYSGERDPLDRATYQVSATPRWLTINCRVQPKVFYKAVKTRLEALLENGYFNRTLFVSPPDTTPTPPPSKDYESPARAYFDQRIRDVLESPYDGEPNVLQFSQEALDARRCLGEAIAKDMVDGKPLADISGAADRILENINRISGGMAFFLGLSEPVPLEYFVCAKHVCLWHLATFQRLFSSTGGLSVEETNATKLEKFLRDRVGNPRFFDSERRIPMRTLDTSGPFRGVGAIEALDSAARHLQGQRLVRVVPGSVLRPRLDAYVQLMDRFFNGADSPSLPSANAELFGCLRDYTMPCRCIRCRY